MAKNRLLIYEPTRWDIAAADPAQEPVSVEEMKAHGRCDGADEDALIAGWIKAGRQHVETMTHRALIEKTFTLKLDKFPDDAEQVIELPGGDLQGVTSINYTDTAGGNQLWDSANYVWATERGTGRIGLAYGKTWPAVREWGLAVTIVYTAGFGANQGDVPEPLRTAVMMIASEISVNRELTAPVQLHPVMMDARRLSSPYRLVRMV